MIKLFTDSDLDGFGCGLVAKIAFGEDVHISYCTYNNLNKRVQSFLENPEHDEWKLYITDLAVNSDVEQLLQKRHKSGKHVQMVDHHVTALHFNEYDWGFVSPEEEGKKTSATTLLYDFLLKKDLIKPNPALEEFIELVRLYDTWDWEVENNVTAKRLNDLFFILDMETFEQEMFARVTENETFTFNGKEQLILDLEERKIERYISSKQRQIVQTMVGDYCIGVVHAERYHSELGNALAKKNPHLDMIAIVNVGTKKMGFRTIYDHADVSEFASRYGGGGHPKASGCFLNEETFKIFVADIFNKPSIKSDASHTQLNKKNSKYSTFYRNWKGDVIQIIPVTETSWMVFHDGKQSGKSFSSFEDAELHLKRKFAAGLMNDHDFIETVKEMLEVSEDTIRNNFDEIMQRVSLV